MVNLEAAAPIYGPIFVPGNPGQPNFTPIGLGGTNVVISGSLTGAYNFIGPLVIDSLTNVLLVPNTTQISTNGGQVSIKDGVTITNPILGGTITIGISGGSGKVLYDVANDDIVFTNLSTLSSLTVGDGIKLFNITSNNAPVNSIGQTAGGQLVRTPNTTVNANQLNISNGKISIKDNPAISNLSSYGIISISDVLLSLVGSGTAKLSIRDSANEGEVQIGSNRVDLIAETITAQGISSNASPVNTIGQLADGSLVKIANGGTGGTGTFSGFTTGITNIGYIVTDNLISSGTISSDTFNVSTLNVTNPLPVVTNYAHASSLTLSLNRDTLASVTNDTSGNVNLLLTNTAIGFSGRMYFTSDSSARTISLFCDKTIKFLSTNSTINGTQFITTASQDLILCWDQRRKTATSSNIYVWAEVTK